MTAEEANVSLCEGTYWASGTWYSSLVVHGDTAVTKSPNGPHDVTVKLGNFGEADPEIIRTTVQKMYNLELSHTFHATFTERGVISKDGLKITMKGLMGIAVLEWMTDEAAAILEAEGDPIEAPPGPYIIQPDNLGKFLWLTGAPGLGKSTSAQLLSKKSGYVYYEGDCFGSCRNPYIPQDVPNPSMAQVLQKPLKGEGLEKRKEACKIASEMFGKMMAGEEYDKENAKEFYEMMCEDIKKERKRIGGDWAVASVTMSRENREYIRTMLGPDLVFVVLNMEVEDVKERVRIRHNGAEEAVDMMMTINKLCEAGTEDEDNTVNIVVTKDMPKEDVVSKILEMIG